MTQLLDLARPRNLVPPSTDRWQLLAMAVFAISSVLPVTLLVWAGFVAGAGAGPGPSAGLVLRGVGGSLATAAASMVVGGCLGIVLGESTRRSRGVYAGALRVSALVPLAVPPVVFALGVRALLEALGMQTSARGETTWVWSTLPLVLAQAPVAMAIVAVSWDSRQPGSDSPAMRSREEGARILGLGPLGRWLMVDRPTAQRALAFGCALAFLHAFSSLAAPLAFPGAGMASLPLLLHRGAAAGISGLGALLPVLITLPLLLFAWRLHPSAVEPSRLGSMGGRPSPWAVPGGIVVAAAVLAPLLAVLVRGFSPGALGALLRGEGGLALSSALGGTVLLALAAAAGALLPLAYVPPSVSRWLRTGIAGWAIVCVPPVSMAALATGAFEGGSWLPAALAVHVALGYVAALPVFARLRSRDGAFSDAARVLGADGMQPAFWSSPTGFVRLTVSAVTLAMLASIGDVATLTPGVEAAAHTLGQEVLTLLVDPGAPSAGAYVVASMLIAFAAGGLLVLLRSGAADEAIWSRR